MEAYGTYSAAALSFSEEFQTHLEQKNLENVESLVSNYPHIHTSLTFVTACTRDKPRACLIRACLSGFCAKREQIGLTFGARGWGPRGSVMVMAFQVAFPIKLLCAHSNASSCVET